MGRKIKVFCKKTGQEFSKEELLEYAKKEMEKENGQDGNIQDSK